MDLSKKKETRANFQEKYIYICVCVYEESSPVKRLVPRRAVTVGRSPAGSLPLWDRARRIGEVGDGCDAPAKCKTRSTKPVSANLNITTTRRRPTAPFCASSRERDGGLSPLPAGRIPANLGHLCPLLANNHGGSRIDEPLRPKDTEPPSSPPPIR